MAPLIALLLVVSGILIAADTVTDELNALRARNASLSEVLRGIEADRDIQDARIRELESQVESATVAIDLLRADNATITEERDTLAAEVQRLSDARKAREAAQAARVAAARTKTAPAAASHSGSGSYTLTAYCPCAACCGKSDGITATGAKATAGRTIAVDPSVIPLGSTVTINGAEYVAEDVGGGVKGNKVDIFFASHEEALAFGRQSGEVTWE